MVGCSDGGTWMPIGGEDMGRSAADTVAADFAASIMAGFDKVADERLARKVEALSERIIAHLPEVVYLPPPPAEVPEERLLSVKEVARLLGCSPRTVQLRMDRGELVYVLERGSENRKMPYSWVVEYIHSLPRYTGKKCEKKEVNHA